MRRLIVPSKNGLIKIRFVRYVAPSGALTVNTPQPSVINDDPRAAP